MDSSEEGTPYYMRDDPLKSDDMDEAPPMPPPAASATPSPNDQRFVDIGSIETTPGIS